MDNLDDILEAQMLVGELEDEEMEFYVDLAMNECQRWLEGLTREIFVDEEDFLYSLRHGTQLRKLLCHTRKCCSFPSKGYHVYCTLDSLQSPDEWWVHSFLSLCQQLNIPHRFLFRPTDLDSHLVDSDRHGKLPECLFAKVRRVITTVYALAVQNISNLDSCGVSCDLAALQPLVGYHLWLCKEGLELVVESNPQVWAKRQLETTVTTLLTELVDFACVSTSTLPCRSSSGFTGDESEETSDLLHVDNMDPTVNDKVSKYLADLSETPPDDHLSDDILPAYSDYEGATLSTRSSSPSDMDRKPRREERIPTRSAAANAGTVAHNPLQFIAPKVAGLAEQAREQLKKAEELKKWKEENLKIASQNEDVEEDWQSGLDLWKSRRRARSSSNHQKNDTDPPPQTTTTPFIRPFRGVGIFEEAPVECASVDVANTSQLQKCKTDEDMPSENLTRLEEHKTKDTVYFEHIATRDKVDALADNANDSNNNNDFDDFSNRQTRSYQHSSEKHRKIPSNSVRFIDDVIEEPIRARFAVKELSKLPAGAPSKRNDWGEEHTDSGVDTRESTSPSRNSGSSLSPRSGTSDELSKDGSTSRKKEFVSPIPPTRSAILIDQPPVHWKFQDVLKRVEELNLTIVRKNCEKGYGFTIKGGKDRKEPVVVDAVVLGSAADRAKLMVGDQVLSINMESVEGKYHAKINMMIREAIVLGEVELEIRRTHLINEPKLSDKNPMQRAISPRAKACFDDKRSMFTHEQYAEYKRTKDHASTGSASSGSSSPFSSRKCRPGRIENFVPEVERSRSPSPVNDYRVVAHGKTEPGRIMDFVPENERSDSESGSIKVTQAYSDRDSHWRKENEWVLSQSGDRPSSAASSSRTSGSRSDYKPTHALRNYDLDVHGRPAVDTRLTVNTHTDSSRASNASSHVSPASSQLTNTSASTQDNDIGQHSPNDDDDAPIDNEAVVFDTRDDNIPLTNDHVSIDQSNNAFMNAKLKRMASTKRIRSGIDEARVNFLGLTNRIKMVTFNTENDQDLIGSSNSLETGKPIPAPRKTIGQDETTAHFHVTSPPHPPYKTILLLPVPQQHIVEQISNSGAYPSTANIHQPLLESHFPPISETLTPPSIQAPPPPPHPSFQIPPPTEPIPHSHVKKDIVFSAEPLPWEIPSRNIDSPILKLQPTNLTETTRIVKETKEVIEHRRSLEPMRHVGEGSTRSPELNYLSMASHRNEYPREVKNAINDHWMVQEASEQTLTQQLRVNKRSSGGPRISQSVSPTLITHYHNLPLIDRQPLHIKQSLSPSPSSNMASPAYAQSQHHAPPSSLPHNDTVSRQENNGLPLTPPDSKDQVVSVSGKQKCSHCSLELGRGAAMIIESLSLFYHTDCFCCYVCGMSLGSGTHGADVRVRSGRLHCHSCYSNDEAGLKFSEV